MSRPSETETDAITREQYVERNRFPELWPGWEQREDGRFYNSCRCAECVAGFTETDFAEDWDRVHAEGYYLPPGGGWAAGTELLRRWSQDGDPQ